MAQALIEGAAATKAPGEQQVFKIKCKSNDTIKIKGNRVTQTAAGWTNFALNYPIDFANGYSKITIKVTGMRTDGANLNKLGIQFGLADEGTCLTNGTSIGWCTNGVALHANGNVYSRGIGHGWTSFICMHNQVSIVIEKGILTFQIDDIDLRSFVLKDKLPQFLQKGKVIYPGISLTGPGQSIEIIEVRQIIK